MNTPLARRIAAAKGQPVEAPATPSRRPMPPHRPAWLERLTAKDLTAA